uniref:Putative secreted protein ovary overexpressed n=1 Tax=Rhipicephalus microplus TaxID=6941 RepID=A0A6M2D8T8_RHIMP
MLNKHVFFLVQMLVAISSSPMPASDQDFCPADVSRALSGEVHGNSTFMNYCSFIEQPGASCALASHAFTSFHVTSSGPGLIYSPPPLRIFSGRGGSVPATMLNKHVFFLVQCKSCFARPRTSKTRGSFVAGIAAELSPPLGLPWNCPIQRMRESN